METKNLEKSASFHNAMAAHHSAMADHHSNLHKVHGEYAALHKATADSLDDTHELKAHEVKKVALHLAHGEHHANLAKVHSAAAATHTAQADNLKTEGDTMNKTVTPPAPALVVTPPPAPVSKEPTMKAEDIKKCAAALGVSEEDFKKQLAPAPPPAPETGVPVTLDAKLSQVMEKLVEKAMYALDNDPKIAESVQQTVLRRVDEALGKKIVPDNISSTIPTDVPFGIRSVSRPGQPDLGIDKAAVPAQFQHLVELNDEV